MTTRAIQKIVQRLYGVEVSATLISEITANLDVEFTAMRTRPLEAPRVLADQLRLKRAVVIARGLLPIAAGRHIHFRLRHPARKTRVIAALRESSPVRFADQTCTPELAA